MAKISHYRYFWSYIVFLFVLLITGAYIANENRYKLAVLVDDFMMPSSEVLVRASDSRPKLIATFRDKPPSMFLYSPGRFAGPLRFVLEEAASEIGYVVDWQQEALSVSLAGLHNNTIDIVPHIRSRTQDRENLYRYSVSLMNQKRSIYFALRDNQANAINALGDLQGLTVGYPQGNHFTDEFQNASAFKKNSYRTIELMVLAFNRQEIDVMVVSSKRQIEQQLKIIGASDVKYATFTLDNNPGLYFLYSKHPTQQAVYDRLDQALIEMKKQGLIEDIFHSFAVAH
jgi:ABC-type amino acid transport substrate-binding protein